MTDSDNQEDARRNEVVVLIHGLASHRISMSFLERHFRKNGYDTINWGYASVIGSSHRHADRLRDLLRERTAQGQQVHVVAHSMGSLITRLAMSQRSWDTSGRIVLVAPPNHGSPAARALAPVLGRICPALSELSSRHDSLVNQLGELQGVQVGIIAAWLDSLVPLSSTMLDGQADRICLVATHNSLLFQKTAARQALAFLSNGAFHH